MSATANPEAWDLTVTQAAARAGVGEKALRRRVAAGTLPARRTAAGHLRFRAADIDALKELKPATATAPGES